MKKLLIPILMCLLLTGCSSKYDLDRISNNILNMYSDIDYVDPKLTKKEKDLIVKFKNEQSYENLAVELNDYFNEYNKTDNPDTYGVYEENGIYYIKYTDIVFDDLTGDGNDTGYSYMATIYCHGYEIYLDKEEVPILYYETKGNNKYKYAYIDKEVFDDEIDYHYKSYEDDSGLTIRYIKDNNKIIDIKLRYDFGVLLNISDDIKTTSIALPIIIFGLGAGIFVFYAAKKIRLARKI